MRGGNLLVSGGLRFRRCWGAAGGEWMIAPAKRTQMIPKSQPKSQPDEAAVAGR
jgi:hypothetical protein